MTPPERGPAALRPGGHAASTRPFGGGTRLGWIATRRPPLRERAPAATAVSVSAWPWRWGARGGGGTLPLLRCTRCVSLRCLPFVEATTPPSLLLMAFGGGTTEQAPARSVGAKHSGCVWILCLNHPSASATLASQRLSMAVATAKRETAQMIAVAAAPLQFGILLTPPARDAAVVNHAGTAHTPSMTNGLARTAPLSCPSEYGADRSLLRVYIPTTSAEVPHKASLWRHP